MNVFCFTGNLGGDAEVKQVSGTSVANFSVAVKSGYGKYESTMWVGCALWGKRAEGGLIQYLKKGQNVAVHGELSVREYDKKDGSKGYALEVNVSDVTLTGGRSENDGSRNASAPQPASAPADSGGFGNFEDDDIPFAPIGLQYRNALHMI